MLVLGLHKEGQFDVWLQTTDIDSSWTRFRGRVGEEKARHYCKYTVSESCILNLYDPVTNDNHYEKENTSWGNLWPVVYETNKYQITIRLEHVDKGTMPKVKHVKREVEEMFFADPDQGEKNFKITGALDFLNEPGVFRLEFEYVSNGRVHNVMATFDVVSPKLDTKNDYISIIRAVDNEYENVVFRYLSMTYQQFSRGKKSNDIIWLNTFEGLVDHYLKYVENIVRQPHTNMGNRTAYAKADKIKRWSPLMEEKYKEIEMAGMQESYYFAYKEPVLNIDTLENRFVKHTVEYLGKRLQVVFDRILQQDLGEKRGDQLAESRRTALTAYGTRLKKLSHHPFFQQVGRWQGMTSESLVLQSRQGYMQIYKDWLKLQRGIDLYNGTANVGTLQIWEIYELWCFIKMKHLVREVMCLPNNTSPDYERFVTEPKGSMLNPFTNSSLEHIVEYRYPDIESADFSNMSDEEIERKKQYLIAHQGDIVTLHYQHTFSRVCQDNFNVHTVTTEQRPDIVLNIKKSDTRKTMLTYLYDAKYRVLSDPKLDHDFELADIEEQASIGSIGADYPPSDAINQMHRYRDAIYYGAKLKDRPESKEVIGGYILFPGRGDDESISNRYFSKSIEKVNIGAFPLTPNSDESKEGVLLRRHLEGILLEKTIAYSHVKNAIPQRGLSYTNIPDDSPVLLIGFVKPQNIEIVKRLGVYYIPIIKTGKDGKRKSYPVNTNYDKAKYLLLHTDDNYRLLFELQGKPQTLTGSEVMNSGFDSTGQPTDLYICYKLKSTEPITLDGFDINSVRISRERMKYTPKYRTIANPHEY